MSAKLVGQVWGIALEPLEKLVLLALADGAGEDGVISTFNFQLLMAMTGLTPEAIQRLCGQLHSRGLLVPLVAMEDSHSEGVVVRIPPVAAWQEGGAEP